MEGFRHQRSFGSDRFLGLYAPPLAANGTVVSAGEDELHEDDIFWTGADPPSSESNLSPMSPSPATANPNPSPALASAGFRHLPERNLGILAALPEDDKKPPTPKARPAFPQRRATTAAVISTSPSSPSTSARMIPSVPKPEPEFALSTPGGKIRHHSAPVNVPMAPPKARRGSGKLEMNDGDLGGDEEMLPPHEIVARRSRNGSPMTTFSVLEGIGRTLRGGICARFAMPSGGRRAFLIDSEEGALPLLKSLALLIVVLIYFVIWGVEGEGMGTKYILGNR